MSGEGLNFGGDKAKRIMRRVAAVQLSTESGYGHRCVSHDRTNPYDRAVQPLEHDGWEAGWLKADRELNGRGR